MIREPDLAALRVLVLVAQENSISAASEKLGVSQQAASARIRGLEADLDVPLLVRTARGSRLTPAGEIVVGWAGRVLDAADEFSDAIGTLRAGRSRTLKVAASLTIAEHLVPEWIALWRAEVGQGGPVVQLAAANSSAVIDAVRTGAAELGFIEAPVVPDDLGSVTVGYDTIEVVVARDHPWADAGTVSIEELAATPLVLRETGSGTRQAFDEALTRVGHPLRAEPAAIEPTSLGIRSAVMAGAAPGALSALAVSADVDSGRLARVRVRNFSIPRPLTAIWKGRAPSPRARDFLEVVAHA